MPAMYPEELAKLRADHPNLQYDFRGNVTGVSPAYAASSVANDIRGIMNGYQQPNAWDFGPTRADFQNSGEFIGPLQPQWWDPNGELAQRGLGALVAGQDLRPRPVAQPQNPYASRRLTFDQSSGGLPGYDASEEERLVRESQEMPLMQQARGLHAGAADILRDAAENTWGINPLGYYPPEPVTRPYGSNADELWTQIQANPGYNPQSSPRGW